MRIIIDVRTVSDHFPGIGRYTFNLVRSLARRIQQDELILLSNPEIANTRFDMAAIASGSGIRIVHTAARPFTLREQICMPGELKALKPDVTHFPYPVLPYAAKRPVVLNVHDIIPIRLPRYFSLRHRILYRVSLRLAMRSASCIVCPSDATLSDLKTAFRLDSTRLFRVPGGVGEPFHPCASSEIELARTAYGLPQSYVLYVGSNKPHKNLPALINAYASLGKAPALVLAGEEDPRYMEARKQAEKLGLTGRIRFMGAVPEKDLPALYSGALAFVFPSRYEGFGFPPLEAMACGVPVACSNIPCLCETVGEAALLFDAIDPASIAGAMERIINDEDLREDLRIRGLHRAAELTWDQAARQTLEIYHLAVNR